MRELGSRHRFYIGLDLGQKRDHTAFTVLDKAEITYDEREPVTYAFRTETRLTVKHIERVPLGTEYPEIVHRVASVVRNPMLREAVTLAVDATGVGAPVVDLLRREKLKCNLIPVVLTGGQTPAYAGSFQTVPRRDLLSNLQVLFEKDRIRLARGMPGLEELMKELAGLRENKTVEKHDDLAFSLALAAWGLRTGAGGGVMR